MVPASGGSGWDFSTFVGYKEFGSMGGWCLCWWDTWTSFVSRVPSWSFHIPWTAHSARPFEAGWYVRVRTCLIPLFLRNEWNSLLMNVVAQSLLGVQRCKWSSQVVDSHCGFAMCTSSNHCILLKGHLMTWNQLYLFTRAQCTHISMISNKSFCSESTKIMIDNYFSWSLQDLDIVQEMDTPSGCGNHFDGL